MKEYNLNLNEDEAVVLFEFFARFGDTEKLEFHHPAEYIALMKLGGQIDKTTSAMFDPNYVDLLKDARTRIACGFEGIVPGIRDGA
jgi:hypothetical protein